MHENIAVSQKKCGHRPHPTTIGKHWRKKRQTIIASARNIQQIAKTIVKSCKFQRHP